MSLSTVGTNATNTLKAFIQNSSVHTTTDLALVRANILNDIINGNPIWPNGYDRAFQQRGVLYVPNRGLLAVFPGDYVAYDATGWPILISKNAIASGSSSWTHVP